MKIPYRYRPGAGFVLLVTTTALAAVFLAWGFGQPRLDRVWLLLELVDQGYELDGDETSFLDEALRTNPAIARDILDEDKVDLLEPEDEGFSTARTVHLVVAPVGTEGHRLVVDCRGATLHPVQVSLHAAHLDERMVFEEDGEKRFVLTPNMASAGPTKPFLVTVRVDGEFEAQGPALVGIRIRAEAE